MSKELKKLDSKRYVLHYVDKNGINTVTGDCEECHCFPCKHVDSTNWSLKVAKKF